MAAKKPSITDRLLARTTLTEFTARLDKSKVHTKSDLIATPIPIMNIGLSGDFTKGIGSGLGQIAGPSRHFKTLFGLLIVGAYLRHHADGVCLFYDSEFGAGSAYFDSFGIDPARVIHTPITNIEELKQDVVQQLEEIQRKDHVIIFVDSVGNLASKKEVDDAKSGNTAADMTRAKQMKSLFRIITPHLTLRDVPMIVINHTYQTQEMFSKTVVSGGTGIMLSSDWVWVVGRSQEKEKKSDKFISGYNFNIVVEKSRYVKEKSKFSVTVTFDKGINKWSGLFDNAIEMGYITKASAQLYTRPLIDEQTFSRKQIDTEEFWKPIFDKTNFPNDMKVKYQLAQNKLISDEEETNDDK